MIFGAGAALGHAAVVESDPPAGGTIETPHTPTAVPTASPSASPSPQVTQAPIDGGPATTSDLLLAPILAAITIGGVLAFVYLRNRH